VRALSCLGGEGVGGDHVIDLGWPPRDDRHVEGELRGDYGADEV
jgi:hypothetical protein